MSETTNTTTASRRSKFSAWCRLLRVPNLFTVPGDPIIGFVVATLAVPHEASTAWASLLWPPVLCALLLYAAGLLANDYFDLAEDRRDRPLRPLPAGDVKPRTALAVALGLIAAAVAAGLLAGVALAGLAAVLGLCVLAYDMALKRVPLLGPLTMGACRGLSLMLGAAALGPAALASPHVLLPAGALALYIAAITLIAAGETRRRPLTLLRWGPAVGMVAFLVTLLLPTESALMFLPALGVEHLWLLTCVLFILAAGQTFRAAEALRGSPEPALVQQTIGRLIRNLLLVHAAVALVLEWPFGLLGAALLVCWPVSALLARRFYAS